MFWVLLATALAGTATLHVGVHRQAGDVYGIAAEGAAGLCTATPVRIDCPADGPVTFRWAGGGDWVLVGDTEVAPDEVGVAWVLASDESRAAELEQLAGAVDRDLVQALFAPAPGIPALPPSMGMIRELERLARHPDPNVRRAVVDALVPLWRHTASDPFHVDAPEVLEPGLITLLANDPDVRVRRRLAARLRDLRTSDVARREEADAALQKLLRDTRPPVQRAATASLKMTVPKGISAGEESWLSAMERVAAPGPPGRAAANTLAFLATVLEPSDVVHPAEAMHRIMEHHPERAWKFWYAWRDDLGWDPDRMRVLLRDTVGLHRGLLRHFARTAPEELDIVLRRWEPNPPHSERWRTVHAWLEDLPPTDDNLSRPGGAPEGG